MLGCHWWYPYTHTSCPRPPCWLLQHENFPFCDSARYLWQSNRQRGLARNSRVLSCSQIGKIIAEGRLIPSDSNLSRPIDNHIIEPFRISDPAYPFTKHVMKNYPGSNLTLEKEHFSCGLRPTGIQFKRAFELLKRRWRCLPKPLDCDVNKVLLNFTSACILHNMCEEQKEHYLEELNRLGKDEIGDLPKPDPLNENGPACSSTIIRNVLANCLYNWSQRSCKHGLSDVIFFKLYDCNKRKDKAGPHKSSTLIHYQHSYL